MANMCAEKNAKKINSTFSRGSGTDNSGRKNHLPIYTSPLGTSVSHTAIADSHFPNICFLFTLNFAEYLRKLRPQSNHLTYRPSIGIQIQLGIAMADHQLLSPWFLRSRSVFSTTVPLYLSGHPLRDISKVSVP